MTQSPTSTLLELESNHSLPISTNDQVMDIDDHAGVEIVPEESLPPRRSRLSQVVCSLWAIPFVLHILLHSFILSYGVMAQLSLGEQIGESGLDLLKKPFFYLPSLAVLTFLSLLAGKITVFQGPFLTCASILSGMVFPFWLACSVSVVISVLSLASFYIVAKPRCKSLFVTSLVDEDPVATLIHVTCSDIHARWFLLMSSLLSIFPNQAIMLLLTVIDLSHWELILSLTYAAGSSILQTFVGFSIAYATLYQTAEWMGLGCIMLAFQTLLALIVFSFFTSMGRLETPADTEEESSKEGSSGEYTRIPEATDPPAAPVYDFDIRRRRETSGPLA